MRALWLMGIFALLAVPGCKEPETSKNREFDLEPLGGIQVPLPVERKLIDNQGRELDARIIGKNQTHLTVIRKLDQERFDVEIASLSLADQRFVLGLLDQRAPEPTDTVRNAQETLNEGRIEHMKREIARREAKKEELSERMLDPTLENNSSPRKRGMMTEIKKIKAEIIELGLELDSLQKGAL